jgi:N-acetyl-gamma-glutamyl-phosphate reductase
VAYFSPEFGIAEAVPQYSGGLGVLAGDHLKAGSDLGVPLVGVGLLYRHGYFRQSLNSDGWQQERYPGLDPWAMAMRPVEGAQVVVDLADDFRGRDGWTYGLTEFMRAEIATATRIANPGCYPTAILLGILPFAQAGMIEGPVIVDALSGVSGAGRRAEQRLLFAELSASASAYGTVEHRHVPEIERGLAELGGKPLQVSFTPHLVPMARGVLTTTRAPLASEMSDGGALEVLRDAYAEEPFIEVLEDWPKTKPVTGTNRAHVSARVDQRNHLLICSTAIDNLGKGAAGQAVQNANVALGIEESMGLSAYGVWP